MLSSLLVFSFLSSVAVDRLEKSYYLKDNSVINIVLLALVIALFFLILKFRPGISNTNNTFSRKRIINHTERKQCLSGICGKIQKERTFTVTGRVILSE